MDMLRIYVEEQDGQYVVISRCDTQNYLRITGPFDNLEDANTACKTMLAKAQEIANRYKN